MKTIMELCSMKLKEELDGRQMEVGDEFVFTFSNATIIYSMDLNEKGERNLGIKIIGGKPVHIDTVIPIFEVEE